MVWRAAADGYQGLTRQGGRHRLHRGPTEIRPDGAEFSVDTGSRTRGAGCDIFSSQQREVMHIVIDARRACADCAQAPAGIGHEHADRVVNGVIGADRDARPAHVKGSRRTVDLGGFLPGFRGGGGRKV